MNILAKIPDIKLRDGNRIPALGLGTWKLSREECINAVRTAINLGYTAIDTASIYGNQKEIGEAIQGFQREKLFITSKVWMTSLRHDRVLEACDSTLKDLQTSYLDLYLIHWPSPKVPIDETLSAMEALRREGKIRSIGVSNFTISHLEEALKTGIGIVNNQVEFHPALYQKELLDFCRKKGVVITAYSPLARGEVCQDQAMQSLAEKYKKTEAQVSLKWLLQKGVVVIPKASSEAHLRENMDIFGWKLDRQDEKSIDALGNENRMVNPFFADFGDKPITLTQTIYKHLMQY